MKTFLLLFLALTTLSQADEFNPTRLSSLPDSVQKKLLALYQKTKEANPQDAPTHYDDLSAFNVSVKDFPVKSPPETTWNAYLQKTPDQVWRGPLVNYGFSYSKRDKRFYYPGDATPQFHEGLVVYNFLNIKGFKMPIAVEVTKIDNERHVLELSYVKGNTSEGNQILELNDSTGTTIIHHTSYYKSASQFRDNYIYPFFHDKTITEHHQHMADELSK